MKKILYIISANFSGSTITDLILANTKNGFSIGEAYAYFYDIGNHPDDPDCSCRNKNCQIWDKIGKSKENIYSNVFNLFPKIEYITDSSKNLDWIEYQSKNIKKYEQYYIFVYKHPIRWLKSREKRNYKLSFKKWLNYYKKAFKKFNPSFILNLREFTKNTQKYIKKISNVCGISNKENQKFYWEKTHHILFGSGTARKHLWSDDSIENYRQIYIPKKLDKYDNKLIEKFNNNNSVKKMLKRLEQ